MTDAVLDAMLAVECSMPLMLLTLTPAFFISMPSMENPANSASIPPTGDNAVAEPVRFGLSFPFVGAIDEFFSLSVRVAMRESDEGDANDGTEGERDRDLVVCFLIEDGGDKVRNLATAEECSFEIEPEEVDLWMPAALSL